MDGNVNDGLKVLLVVAALIAVALGIIYAIYAVANCPQPLTR